MKDSYEFVAIFDYAKDGISIPQWLNKLAEMENVNFSKILQAALKDYLKVKRRI